MVSDTDPEVLKSGLDEIRSYARPGDDLVFETVALESFEAAMAAVNPRAPRRP